MIKQQELFKAETNFFFVLKHMIDAGIAGDMGGTTFLVYCTIKAHSNVSSGTSFPSLELISEKAKISKEQVKRCINKLIEMEYVTKTPRANGRCNSYTLREKVEIHDQDGQAVALATWDYTGASLGAAVSDIKNVVLTGDLGGAKIVHIEKLTVQNIYGDSNTVAQFNIDGIADPELKGIVQDYFDSKKGIK